MKRALTLLSVLCTFVATLTVGTSASMAATADGGVDCQHVAAPDVPGATVESLTGVDKPAAGGVPARCEVDLYLTHPSVGDHVRVAVWLPSSGWNGRYQGTGGASWAAGVFDFYLAPAVAQGFAAASTDAGTGTNQADPSSWALKADGTVNTELLTNFASRSVHDMTVAAKQVITSFYGKAPSYSYWNSCSTGGRQGLMEAQRYPTDYNGIVAAAPAINEDRLTVGGLWPQVLMNESHDYLSSCKLNAFTQAAIAQCDTRDGAPADGIIEQPEDCDYDPHGLVGQTVVCDGQSSTITTTDADVVAGIWRGPTSPDGRHNPWYGMTRGAALDQVAAITTDSDGTTHGAPFPVTDTWIRYFLKKQPSFDTSTVTRGQFAQLFVQSQNEYNKIIGTDDPDLTAFRNAGGKMITWHGQADQIITPLNTVDYIHRVWSTIGSAADTNSFYRVFFAPGAGHCGLGSYGPFPPDNGLGAVMNWVENGQAPATLPAAMVDGSGATVTRNLCLFPQTAHYDGHGDPKAAASYHCAA